MSYADISDLRVRLGSIFSEIYPSDDAASEDLKDAQAEINGALALRYIVPVEASSEVASLLKYWTLDLASELAFTRTAGSTCPDKIRRRADKVRSRLADVREGRFLLPGAAERESASLVSLSMEKPVFGRDTLRRF